MEGCGFFRLRERSCEFPWFYHRILLQSLSGCDDCVLELWFASNTACGVRCPKSELNLSVNDQVRAHDTL